MATICKLFDDRAAAQEAVRRLESSSIPTSDISIVSNNADNWYNSKSSGRVDRDGDGVDDRAEGASAGAGIGAAVGGAAGLLAGLGLMAIPGVGPVVAAGWLVSTAAGAIAGGATGGVIGALTQSGVTEQDAHVYAEGVRRGGTLVSVRVPDSQQASAESILASSSVDLPARRAAYQSQGWTTFDDSLPAYTSEQIAAERGRYR